MSSINPKELYLRIVTQRGTRTLCHDIVVCCGEEELTDELCERKRLEIVACMQEELEPGEKIVSAEYVSKDSLTPAVRDNDKVVQWRTMDFIAYALSYAFDDDGAAHPQFVPTVLLRVLVNDNPCTMSLHDREHMLFPDMATAETGETAGTAESAAVADFAPVMNFEAGEEGIQLSQESYLPLTLSDAKVFVPCADIEEPCTVVYRSEDSTAQAGAYRLALVNGDASNSMGEFQNGDETLLSGARNVLDDVYLTVAVTLDEEHRSEQVDAIKKLLANTVISDATPKVALFGETLADDVSLEISDSYMQLQKGTDTVLVSAFQQSIDTSLLSKSLTLPNGLTLKYGDVKDSQTGYIPFIATLDGREYKFLATSSDVLLNMFII